MEEEDLEDFFIETIEEREPIIAQDKIYFNPGRDEMYYEGWHS